MPMTSNGTAKLVEEIGELQVELGQLQQLLGKKLAYFHTDVHPDGLGPLSTRLENEMADVIASIAFVIPSLKLDLNRIHERSEGKLKLFLKWNTEEEVK